MIYTICLLVVCWFLIHVVFEGTNSSIRLLLVPAQERGCQEGIHLHLEEDPQFPGSSAGLRNKCIQHIDRGQSLIPFVAEKLF